jgi:PAS domain S-box-containing protein
MYPLRMDGCGEYNSFVLLETDDAAARLAAIVKSSDDAIISKDLSGTITSWNTAAERLFGYTAAEVVGKSIHIIIPIDRRAEEDYVLAQVRAGVGVDHFETVRRRKDGTFVDISLTVSPILSATGEIIGASKIARDITEARRLRRQVEEASRAKDEFLALLSHELRTPLNTVLGYAMMLQHGNLPSDQQMKAAAAIGRNASALMRLVNDVFDTAAIIAGKMQLDLAPCDLSAVVADAVESIRPTAAAKGLTLEASASTGLLVSGDADRLRQVLWNVLSNAVKFTPAGGVRVTARPDGADAHVLVEDTGIGLLPEAIPRIFQRFWQADGRQTGEHGGLGLGLALARYLVELHGGRIAASSPGRGLGTTFEIRLPLQKR